MDEHVAHIGELRDAYKLIIRKPEGKRLYGRSGSIRQDDIKMEYDGCGLD